MSELVPGKLYKTLRAVKFYPTDSGRGDELEPNTIVVFIYEKLLKRFSDTEQVHQYFLHKNQIWTFCIYNKALEIQLEDCFEKLKDKIL